ncbi:MAG: DegT/DnrJ/EryC1/StrS family aminotransferase [Armatimonadota bacterium]
MSESSTEAIAVTEQERRNALARGGPSIDWQGEPHLGSYYGQPEIDAVVDCIKRSMAYNEGFGFITDDILDFEAEFAEYIGTEYAVSINGAGSGLDMVMMCLDLQPDDEVIVPALNFRAAPLSVLGQGAKLVLCDCDPRTLQADPADVERRITENTRAIYPVHMNGLSAPMDDLAEVAGRHKHHREGEIRLITDAARALGGGYKGEKIGKHGWMTVFSFHTMKNMTTLGEGGAVVTDDEQAHEMLRGIRQFGNETSGWGTNYKMTRVQAAVGSVQLKKLDEMIDGRRRLAARRTEMLADNPYLITPYEPEDCRHSYYLYTLLVPEDWAGEKRDNLMELLAEEYRVNTVVANPPVTRIKGLLGEATSGQEVPVSEELGNRLLCAPIHPKMPDADNRYICAALWEAADRIAKS